MNGRFTEILLASVFLILIGLVVLLVRWNTNPETVGWVRTLADGFGGALLLALKSNIGQLFSGTQNQTINSATEGEKK